MHILAICNMHRLFEKLMNTPLIKNDRMEFQNSFPKLLLAIWNTNTSVVVTENGKTKLRGA